MFSDFHKKYAKDPQETDWFIKLVKNNKKKSNSSTKTRHLPGIFQVPGLNESNDWMNSKMKLWTFHLIFRKFLIWLNSKMKSRTFLLIFRNFVNSKMKQWITFPLIFPILMKRLLSILMPGPVANHFNLMI